MINRSTRKILTIGIIALLVSGCQTLNSRMGNDLTDYKNAKELPPIKLPAGSVPVSNRYDIPEVPGNQNCIIENTEPPNF